MSLLAEWERTNTLIEERKKEDSGLGSSKMIYKSRGKKSGYLSSYPNVLTLETFREKLVPEEYVIIIAILNEIKYTVNFTFSYTLLLIF